MPAIAVRKNKSSKPPREFALTKSQRVDLREKIEKAKAKGKVVDVKGYKRNYYRLSDAESRRLARFRDLEYSVYRLCSDFDRRGKTRLDRAAVERVIQLLTDTFINVTA